jgi:hypothetical protein
MTIVFGWKYFRLKSFTFQELNLPELEQFPNATLQVAQSYFHLFYIPVFPTGRSYRLEMDNQLYHVPPSLMKMLDTEQLKARGKWYAWTLPLVILLIFAAVKLNQALRENRYEEMNREFAQMNEELEQMKQKFFNDPEVGDHILFTGDGNLSFDAEVFVAGDKKITLFVNLMEQLDQEALENARTGKIRVDADSIRTLLDQRNELLETSSFKDSLYEEHPLQPVYRKLLLFGLEEYPIRYQFIEMSRKEYQALKESLGDGATKQAKKIKIPAFREITKQALLVEPD